MKSSSEKNFRDFFKNNIDFLFILDMEGNVIETNNTVNSILGYTQDELIGKSVLLVHPPELREKAREIVGKMIAGEEASCPIPLLSKKNGYIPVETRVFEGVWNAEKALIGVSRNLTALKLSEEKFFSVFNHSRALMAISTIDTGIFVNVNKQFLTTLGYAEEEIIGTASKDLELFNDYGQRAQALDIFEKEGHLKDFEVIVKTKSGELLNCLFSLDKIKIQTYQFILTSASNVTQIKIAESKINYLFKQQKLLADISQLLNRSTNAEHILDDVLKLIGEHTGVSRVYVFEDAGNGTSAANTFEWCNAGIAPQLNVVHEIPYKIIPSWKKLLNQEGHIISENISELPGDIFALLEPQGIKSIIVYPLFVQNAFYGYLGLDECVNSRTWTIEELDLMHTISNIISNALERKRVLKKLENSELRLKLAMSSTNEGLWDWNNMTGSVYYSETWCRMLGYEPEEIEPNISSWEKLLHPEDKEMIMEALHKHLNGETESYETTHRLKTKDGNWKWILDHGLVVQRDIEGQPLRTIGTHIDVTRQKETEQQLQELLETKNKLFSIIAHDLRGPIGNFLPILEILTSEEGLEEDMKNEFLEDLKKSSITTFNLLDKLLLWSKSQTNTILLKPARFVINHLIYDNVELLSPSANQKTIKIAVKAEENLSVFADRDSINIVIRNLLSNAIKFTPNNGMITILARDSGEFIELEVADNGVGMKKEIADNLFKMKSFHSTYGTNYEKGSGIGLILCKDFVGKNGGEIRVESAPDQGSRFIFTIPKAD
jgi:PAS domain S-box-containing protein